MPLSKSLISRVKSKALRSVGQPRKVESASENEPLKATAPRMRPRPGEASSMRHYRMALMGSFAAEPGNGLVISVLRRAIVLRDRGNSVDIVAFPFDTRFRDAARTVSKSYSLGDAIALRNPYFEISGDNYRREGGISEPLPTGEEWEIVVDPKDPNMRRAYRNGVYERFIFSDRNTTVVFVDYLGEGGKRFKRSWHDVTGRITKCEHFSAENKPVSVDYIHLDGSRCLTASVNALGVEHDFNLTLPDGRIGSFATVAELEAWWLVNFVLDSEAWNPIVSEYGFRANVFALAAKSRRVSVAYALHNLHLTAPYSYGSALKEELAPFFEHLAEYDAVVALTEEQRLDLIRSMDSSDNVFVIPHHFEGEKNQTAKAPRSVVMSSRIVRTKGHFDAVKIWPQILEQFPDAVLNIYGTGPDLEPLRTAVRDAGLSSSILLHGFEKNVVQKVSEAEIAILPSQFEGFPLSLIETMSVGTVPVAYDFKYGARAMIQHGVNGFITERSNTQELADSVIYLMKNPSVRQQFSEAARLITEQFSAQRLGDEWIALFDELERRSKL